MKWLFLIEYIIFFPVSIIGGVLLNPNTDPISFRLIYIGLFSISHFVVKFFLYRYLKSFELKPFTCIIIAFIINFHILAPIPILLLLFDWIEFWKWIYSKPDLIISFTMPAYLAFSITIYLFLSNKNIALRDVKMSETI
jgi:hypothetical protein